MCAVQVFLSQWLTPFFHATSFFPSNFSCITGLIVLYYILPYCRFPCSYINERMQRKISVLFDAVMWKGEAVVCNPGC